MNPWLILLALIVIALVFVVIPVGLAAYRQWRRPWRFTCPRAGMTAQIQVDAARASFAEVLGGKPEIDRCTLWPELLGCQQGCLALPADARQMRRGEAPPRLRPVGVIRLILVPLDGGPKSEQILPAVTEFARDRGATLRLLRVIAPVCDVRGDDDQVIAYADQETARVLDEAYDYLRRVARGLDGLPLEAVVRVGDPVAEIVAESESSGTDLIAVPTHQLSGLGWLIDNRMAPQLQRATTIPVLVVPTADPVTA